MTSLMTTLGAERGTEGPINPDDATGRPPSAAPARKQRGGARRPLLGPATGCALGARSRLNPLPPTQEEREDNPCCCCSCPGSS